MTLIYILGISFWVLLGIAFIVKSYPLGLISSMAIMTLGVYILSYGIETIISSLTIVLGIINVLIGFYVFMNGSLEEINQL